MLWIFAAVLFVAWIVGLIKEPMGGFVHVLLLLAAIAAGTELALWWRREYYATHADDSEDDLDLRRSA